MPFYWTYSVTSGMNSNSTAYFYAMSNSFKYFTTLRNFSSFFFYFGVFLHIHCPWGQLLFYGVYASFDGYADFLHVQIMDREIYTINILLKNVLLCNVKYFQIFHNAEKFFVLFFFILAFSCTYIVHGVNSYSTACTHLWMVTPTSYIYKSNDKY